LDSLGGIDQNVGSSVFGTEAPDFQGIVLVPSEVVAEFLASDFRVILWSDIALFDFIGELFVEGFSSTVKSVVLIWGFSETNLA
jgi:hypothetical protein